MQAKLRATFKSLKDAITTLSRLQRVAICTLLFLLCSGGMIAFVRSRPRPVDIKPSATATRAAREKMLTVHIAGAVANPGLYRLAEGSRVADALSSAGGAAQGAILDDLNLASLLKDGQKVLVPRGEEPGGPPAAGAQATTGSRLVNVNTADEQELDTLPGVGPSLAARILEYRKKNGPFSSVEDLDNVEGIGPSRVDSLKDLVAF